MLPVEKRWEVAPPILPEVNQQLLPYPQLLRQLLYNRGITSVEAARQFLNAEPPADTDPNNLKSMSEAVDRLRFAILNHESIAIYGDYDADGVTATVLLVQVLKTLGGDVQEYIPNRFEEGYGVNQDALSTLHEAGVKLVVTVDCGMRSAKETDYARHLGLDIIITDHHLPGETIPQASAIINPKQAGDEYPYKDLAGVGLAYKLACAVWGSFDRPPIEVDDYLDLVAIGTVADMAPLTGENRSLVRQGLMNLRQTTRQGIMALAGVSGIKLERINAGDLGYAIGPRLNAAGRLESALAAFHLLTTQDVHETGRLAQELDNRNRERQKITREIQEAAQLLAFTQDPQPLLIFAYHPDFNLGVVGLAASRLCELYYRPTIVANYGPDFTVGSCRSIPELHITQALDQCSDLMEKYGGHSAAAGFSIRNDNLPELISRLNQIACQQLDGLDLRPVLSADMEVTLSELKPEILEYLDWLQPTGIDNPTPIFVTRDVKVLRHQLVGREADHLKLVVTDGRITFDAIAFRQGHHANQLPPRVDLMFTYELNTFNGRTNLQLNVRDMKAAE